MANDNFVVDLTQYKDRLGERIAPGTYRVRVDDMEMDQTRDGRRMINLWFSVVGGEFDGATVIDRLLPDHPNSLFRIVGFIQALGMKAPKKRLNLNFRQFLGKVLDIEVDDGEPYNGRVRSEVRNYMQVEKGTAVDLEDVGDEDEDMGSADEVDLNEVEL